MNPTDLFNEFDPVASKAFKQKIQFDLKGLSYNDTLITHTLEGIDIKPFYHRDEIQSLSIPNLPGCFPLGMEHHQAIDRMRSAR